MNISNSVVQSNPNRIFIRISRRKTAKIVVGEERCIPEGADKKIHGKADQELG